MFVVWCTEVVSSAFIIFFFFKQKTAYEMRISDWSSDVCSSDLVTMRDGCRIAVDLWLPQPLDGAAAAPERVPTIAILTPYYRRFALKPGSDGVEAGPNAARYRDALVPRGSAVLVVEDRKSTRLNSRH